MSDDDDNPALEDDRLRPLDSTDHQQDERPGDNGRRTAANGHGAQRGTDGSLPQINASDLDLPRVAAAAWNSLEAANTPPRFFRQGSVVARLETGQDGSLTLRTLTESRLRYELARVAKWRQRKGRSMVDALPPMHVVRDMLARPAPPLPPLARITAAPVFSAAGTLRTQVGYDAASETYYAPGPGFALPTIPDRPTDDELERARALILTELLGDFPFVSDAERAHALGLLLLPFLRELIQGPVPLFVVEKPTPGTGASLLVDMLMGPALGRSVPVMTEGRDEDEWRKRLTAKLLSAPQVIFIDNLRHRLDSAALSAAITATMWEDRILSRSEMGTVPIRCAWVATGNNPALSNEMVRRSVRIRLDAKRDRPFLREGFRHPDLRAWAAAHRAELVWAALTIVQAWVAAGRPPGGQSLGQFEQWARTTGGVLDIAGVPGFLANAAELYDTADAEAAAWRAFVGLWWERHGNHEVGVGELWTIIAAPDSEVQLDLGRDSNERSQRTRLGLFLKRLRDRQFDDLRIVAGGTRRRAQLWRLEQCV
jgi:putative DNA primase/helicase